MNTLRQIRQIIYRLKRDFGTSAVLLKTGGSTVDLETGVVARVVTEYPISRAVILPKSILRQFLSPGHTVDTTKRTCLIERKDIGVGITNGDTIRMGAATYSIAVAECDLSDENYLLELKRVEGQ